MPHVVRPSRGAGDGGRECSGTRTPVLRLGRRSPPPAQLAPTVKPTAPSPGRPVVPTDENRQVRGGFTSHQNTLLLNLFGGGGTAPGPAKTDTEGES